MIERVITAPASCEFVYACAVCGASGLREEMDPDPPLQLYLDALQPVSVFDGRLPRRRYHRGR